MRFQRYRSLQAVIIVSVIASSPLHAANWHIGETRSASVENTASSVGASGTGEADQTAVYRIMDGGLSKGSVGVTASPEDNWQGTIEVPTSGVWCSETTTMQQQLRRNGQTLDETPITFTAAGQA